MKKIMSLAAVILFFGTTNVLAQDEMQSSPNATKASYDIQFLDTMIAHHEQGISMAEIIVNKSQNEAVKNKAQMMINIQKSEISKLQTIRDDIDEDAPLAINMSLGGMRSEDLRILRAQSLKSCDEKFLKMSISHDEGGLKMSKEAALHAQNLKVQEIARSLSKRQSAEISNLKEMLRNQF